jgi:hypothetical protein
MIQPELLDVVELLVDLPNVQLQLATRAPSSKNMMIVPTK